MAKKVLEDFEFETCPHCGGNADWTGSEVDKESYYDNYICKACGKKYTVVFEMVYEYHLVEE